MTRRLEAEVKKLTIVNFYLIMTFINPLLGDIESTVNGCYILFLNSNNVMLNADDKTISFTVLTVVHSSCWPANFVFNSFYVVTRPD